MLDVKYNGNTIKVKSGKRIMDIIDNKDLKYYAVEIDNEVFELTDKITKSCELKLLGLEDFNAIGIYKSSLRFLISLACKKLFPKENIHFYVSVSLSFFVNFSGDKNHFTNKEIKQVKEEVEKLIKADYKIEKKTMNTEDAIKLFEKNGMLDKVKILKYRQEKTIDIYECENYSDYLYCKLVPSLGYLKKYEILPYSPGFLLRYPRLDLQGLITPFEDDIIFRRMLVDVHDWSGMSDSSYISNINDIIEKGEALEYINMCECRHNRELVRLVDEIEKKIRRIKMIFVAGPSSSGKTTFTNRVRMELKSRGIEPLMISMDNFYLPDSKVPKGKDGKPDYEHIDALDLEFFDDVILRLTQGEEVKLPIWDFKGQKRTFTEPVKLLPDHQILIEGIHALNHKICPSIPDSNKFKIFISPLLMTNIDEHTPLPVTELRLIRRMIRDYLTRGCEAERTFSLWPSVREGEFKWIYPNLKYADFVFNTELDYELCVFKTALVPLLSKVPQTSTYYYRARKLIEYLNLFKEITYKWIPCTSILREFIGDSIFYTEDKK